MSYQLLQRIIRLKEAVALDMYPLYWTKSGKEGYFYAYTQEIYASNIQFSPKNKSRCPKSTIFKQNLNFQPIELKKTNKLYDFDKRFDLILFENDRYINVNPTFYMLLLIFDKQHPPFSKKQQKKKSDNSRKKYKKTEKSY